MGGLDVLSSRTRCLLQCPQGGTAIVASDHTSIINDDMVGGVTTGGDFCLDLYVNGDDVGG